ncbi:alanine dehydrogenase [Cellvibrio sp. OA-2007]|uniref:alanine dehydrogenase n=1 Tax=Cellvibrio sp. OA-2007 TaxID=529823 RepID=UPI000780BBFD|nr:alanine dehydrogenase [Cellvibrio sp. OA-2007]
MRIGIPREIKAGENRVALKPAGAAELHRRGHSVYVMSGAGQAAGFSDACYQQAGAHLLNSLAEVYVSADLIVKVKEPQLEEYALLNDRHLLFTYLHLAANRTLTEALLASGATCIAYETLVDGQGRLPLLTPMSEIAGRMAVQAGAHHLEMAQGGKGVLLGGIPGVAPAKVLILGGGVVGANAAAMAVGLGAQVHIMDKSLARLRQLDEQWRGRVICEYATQERIDLLALQSDLIIGSVLNAGASAPKLLSRGLIAQMENGSVLVDVAIDQGGCFATSKPTTHQHPTYIEEGVVHYCVANIPSAVGRTATLGLTNATLPYIIRLAEKGFVALQSDAGLLAGLNIYRGQLTQAGVAESFSLPCSDAALLLPKR